jgi:hypothetical protein
MIASHQVTQSRLQLREGLNYSGGFNSPANHPTLSDSIGSITIISWWT